MRERQSRHLKKWFFANDGPIYFYINGTIWQTLFHGTNFIFRIKLKRQTENLKFQPVHFYVTATGYKPPPPQKKTWKFTSDDDNLIPFHFIPLFYCLTNKSHWMEIRIKLKIHNVHDTPLSRRKERKLVIRSQDPKTFKNISLLLTFNANQLPGFYIRAKLRFNQLTTQHSKMFYHISLGEKSCQKCHQENKNRLTNLFWWL